ncbi:alpha/beta hydrolase [Paracoccus limosus]|jgi:phospholipase/carboxylesterase|uniref:Alpha/beta hydrolase n=1 Tax=Paracoccus limosus TaxID=913252 RepID=A0A844H464_9RHOB|nr:alpha/beta hydrolase [Paracoccus limosus]MTH34344.1 alpha/beta hydrolase [Paracoccus limosus]
MAYHSFRQEGAPDKPVVLAFHGTGGDEHQFVDLVRRMLPGAGIVAPRGDVSEHGANRFFRRTGEGVYDMDDLALRTRAMLDFVTQVRADFAGRPLFALGYSNGANILAAMLFQQPDLFDRAALLHPLIPWVPAPQPGLRDRPVFISAGRNDPICPLPESLALIDWFSRQGARVESRIEAGGHQILPSELNALHRFLASE